MKALYQNDCIVKKNNFKSSRLLASVLMLFALTCFYSCDKSGRLDGTTWESEYFEVKYRDPIYPPLTDYMEEFVWKGKMSISFKNHVADVFIQEFELTGHYMFDRPRNQLADYTYEGKNLILYFDETGYFPGQNWIGTVNKKTMTLRCLGNTIVYKKK